VLANAAKTDGSKNETDIGYGMTSGCHMFLKINSYIHKPILINSYMSLVLKWLLGMSGHTVLCDPTL
jgi:hypothetical protein